MGYPFLGGNVFDTEWDEQVFESTAFFERVGVNLLSPLTILQETRAISWKKHPTNKIIAAREQGAEIVVLLSHNGFDVDQKIARLSLSLILTGHTHDAIPQAIRFDSGSLAWQISWPG